MPLEPTSSPLDSLIKTNLPQFLKQLTEAQKNAVGTSEGATEYKKFRLIEVAENKADASSSVPNELDLERNKTKKAIQWITVSVIIVVIIAAAIFATYIIYNPPKNFDTNLLYGLAPLCMLVGLGVSTLGRVAGGKWKRSCILIFER